ncbi:PREDICTED: uncharacterized protein LOC107073258 [Polistes dominula]|uniref:Uncharacterized protein LOC107073258 n=1 Tax=Polistes dominula TaxID=743375 RepID=A0ABM1JA18_POLDO|nr:PREDICTED: uncharacterized protein LOC107073258 [Polistes dominula]
MVAGIIPLDHLAPRLAEAYAALRDLKGLVLPGTRARLGVLARRGAIAAWREEELGLLDSPVATGVRVREALAGRLVEWVERPHSIESTFRTTQLMTGHGCFSAYVHRIGKRESTQCFHCEAPCDDVEHTLLDCPAWVDARDNLAAAIGAGRPTLPEIIRASLDTPGGWSAFQSFAERVIKTKLEEERRRERRRVPGRAREGPQRSMTPMRPPRARLRPTPAASGPS